MPLTRSQLKPMVGTVFTYCSTFSLMIRLVRNQDEDEEDEEEDEDGEDDDEDSNLYRAVVFPAPSKP